MLVVGSNLIGKPLLSIHVGGEIARLEKAIVDPDNLKIIAYQVDGPLIKGEVGNIVLIDDVREMAPSGMIVDSIDELVQRSDVVRIDKIMALNFNLLGMKVETKAGKKIGKVTDYTVDMDSFSIYQLVVRRSAVKAIVDPELIINRSQVVEITDYKVIIKNEEEKVPVEKAKEKKDFVPNFVNPFREPQFSPIRNRNPDEPDTE